VHGEVHGHILHHHILVDDCRILRIGGSGLGTTSESLVP
jgi:hypothetical protein